MKNYILLLLLATFGMQAQTLQNPTFGNLKLKNNQTSTTATKVNVQENDGTINTISKSDLVDVIEVNDVSSLPLIGVAGKIYVVKNLNKIYRWNGTFYQELSFIDISGLQSQIDLKANDSDVVHKSGNETITGVKSFQGAVPEIKLVETTNNNSVSLRSNSVGSSSFGFYGKTGKKLFSFVPGISGEAKMVIGDVDFPNDSQLLVYGGGGGANIDARGSNSADESNLDLENSDWLTNPKSIGLSTFGDNFNLGGDILGYERKKSSVLRFSNDKSFITSLAPIKLGINNLEIGNVNSTGIEAISFTKSLAPATNILLAGGGDISQASLPISTATQTALNLKANLASPALTGTPTAPTATAGTNTTQIATTAFVTGANAGNVKLTGNQTIGGFKIFTETATFPAVISNTEYRLMNDLGDVTATSANPVIVRIGNDIAVVSVSSKAARFNTSLITSVNKTFTFPNQTGTFALTNNPTPLTATSFIKSSAPTTNILLAGGGDIAQNTAFNKNFGTTVGTVVEGGTLGSNAYTSTAYLPLSGGNISGSVGIGTTSPNRKLEVADIDSQFSLKGSITGAPVYQTWYNSSNVRRGFFGFASMSNNNITLANEEVGNIYISPNNGSTIVSSTVTATSYTATSLPVFENNAAASSLSVGQFYRTSTGVLMVKF